MKFTLFVLLVISFIFLNMTNSHAFRCGGEPVGIYDSANDVLSRCGQPSRKGYTRVNFKGQIINAETWFYNCGDNDFIYAVIIVDNKVFREEATERGSGESECDSPHLK